MSNRFEPITDELKRIVDDLHSLVFMINKIRWDLSQQGEQDEPSEH